MGMEPVLTVEDLLTIPRLDVGHYELSRGELIIAGTAGPIHEQVKSIIACLLTLWNGRFVHGWV
jgi:Uma2 family endonuclease